MAAERFTAVMQSSVSGPLNPAFVDFTFTSPLAVTDPQAVALVIAYMASAMAYMGEAGTYIVGVNKQSLPGGPILAQPFPVTEYGAITAAAVLPVAAPAMTTYGSVALGDPAATSSGRGDSFCINTRAPSAGRHGKGRHFHPFLARGAVDTTGLMNTVISTKVAACYQLLFGGTGPTPYDVNLEPVVWSPSLGTAALITTVSPNQIPSRLRSRTK
jgi:hypothetical protein